ncbi:MAG: 5-(carboxyamino)imidazole ribonucleotide mutase [Candidatus Micrarchaeota archaeon]
MKSKIAILMGSESDLPHAKKIGETLKEFGVSFEFRVASAHRTPAKVMSLVKELEKENSVIIAIAGLSNALSGMVAGISAIPVITCPPNADDLMSSLRMPSGVAHATVLDPKNAALMAVKILAFNDPSLKRKVQAYLKAKQMKIGDADDRVRRL